jgi:hypothetical protein
MVERGRMGWMFGVNKKIEVNNNLYFYLIDIH